MPGAYLYGFDETTGEPVMCRVTADGKLIVNAASIVENPPTEDQALKAPTSEWAYDHWKDVDAHHAPTVAGDLNHQDLANRSTDDHHTKFTAAEARAAINDIFGSDGKGDKDIDMDNHYYKRASQVGLMSAGEWKAEATILYAEGTPAIRMIAKDTDGAYQNFTLRKYNGSTDKLFIDQENFQAELDDYLENPPTQDSANTAPTSEWAYDHWKDAAAHHAKMTSKEAVDAFGDRVTTLTTGTYTNTDFGAISMVLLNSVGGNITLNGFANGYTGQIVIFVRINSSNQITIAHEAGAAAAGDKIRTPYGADDTMFVNNYGGFILVYDGTYWVQLTNTV